MIVYEVNIRVVEAAADDYRAWLIAHVAEILRLPGFVDAKIFTCSQLLSIPADAEPGRDLCVHYRLQDETALQVYLAEHAPRLRQDGVDRFAGKFSVTRRVLQPVA